MSTAETLITKHLDTWTSAIKAKSSAGRGGGKKQEFYGLKKLRELILELAVRGLLVPQDPNNEPASHLLSKIAKEKAHAVKEGREKKGKPLPKIKADELPYELPIGWSWARFGAISTIERGGSPRPIQSYLTDSPDGLNWIKIGDTDQGGKYIRSTGERIRPDGLKKTRMVYPGDFLLTNSMSFGRPYITLIEGCIHDGWLRISPPESLDKDYLYNLLSSPVVHRFFKDSAAGAVVQNLNSEKVRLLPISLPPLAEQHRIVAKVDELMALCDQLERQQEDSVRTHASLVETLLGALTAASERGAFAEAWQRIASHFDTLFTTESSIDQLKQTILQLAVMGKLVEQDPEDEPAKELYSRIKKIKEALIADKMIKRVKVDPNPSHDTSLELPSGWIWSRLGNTFDVRDGTHDTPKYTNEGFPLITSKNIYTGQLDFDGANFISEEDHRKICERSKVDRGDILFAMIGSIGNPTIVDTEREFSIKNVALFKYFSATDSDPRFLLLYLNHVAQEMKAQSAGGVQSFVSLGFLRNYLFPLPPLAEQHRIVAKVDELMALCDRLKASLQSAQATQLHLADTLVENAARD